MSKQSEAKERQDYRDGPASCKSCQNYRADIVPRNRWEGDPYTVEKNRRCSIGGFAVKPLSHCSLFVSARL